MDALLWIRRLGKKASLVRGLVGLGEFAAAPSAAERAVHLLTANPHGLNIIWYRHEHNWGRKTSPPHGWKDER